MLHVKLFQVQFDDSWITGKIYLIEDQEYFIL